MKIRTRILSGFVLIAVIGLALGIVGLVSNVTLTRQSTELQTLQLTSNSIVDVLEAHNTWRQNLTEAVMYGTEFKSSLDSESCSLSAWLESDESKNITDSEILAFLEQIEKPHRAMHVEAANIVSLIETGQLEEAHHQWSSAVLPEMQNVTYILNEIEMRYIALSDKLASEIIQTGTRLNILIVSLIVAALAACILIAIILIRWIINKIYWYENILDCIPFPLSITDNKKKWTFINKAVEEFIGIKRADAIGRSCESWDADICKTLNCGISCLERGRSKTTFEEQGMFYQVDVSYLTNNKNKRIGHIEVVQNISKSVETQKTEAALVKSINHISQSFIEETGNVSSGAQALASGTVQQSATMNELSTFVTAIAEKTKHNAETAEQAENLADAIKEKAEMGNSQMNEMIEAVKQINESNKSISIVIKAIDDIAFKTNILALNAAVEAARAGQHGKGFAVVAEEVRNLAVQSADAANDTESIIANSIEKSEHGVRIAAETATSLSEIVSSIGESSQLITEIAAASDEQAHSIRQINANIEEVARIMQQNSDAAQIGASAAEEMSKQANLLENSIEDFNLHSAANREMFSKE